MRGSIASTASSSVAASALSPMRWKTSARRMSGSASSGFASQATRYRSAASFRLPERSSAIARSSCVRVVGRDLRDRAQELDRSEVVAGAQVGVRRGTQQLRVTRRECDGAIELGQSFRGMALTLQHHRHRVMSLRAVRVGFERRAEALLGLGQVAGAQRDVADGEVRPHAGDAALHLLGQRIGEADLALPHLRELRAHRFRPSEVAVGHRQRIVNGRSARLQSQRRLEVLDCTLEVAPRHRRASEPLVRRRRLGVDRERGRERARGILARARRRAPPRRAEEASARRPGAARARAAAERGRRRVVARVGREWRGSRPRRSRRARAAGRCAARSRPRSRARSRGRADPGSPSRRRAPRRKLASTRAVASTVARACSSCLRTAGSMRSSGGSGRGSSCSDPRSRDRRRQHQQRESQDPHAGATSGHRDSAATVRCSTVYFPGRRPVHVSVGPPCQRTRTAAAAASVPNPTSTRGSFEAA